MEQSRFTEGGDRLYKMNESYFREFVKALNELGVGYGNISMSTVQRLISEQLTPQEQEVVTRRLVNQSLHGIAEAMGLDEAFVKSIVDEAPYRITPPNVQPRKQ